MKKLLYSVLFLFVVLIACSKEEEPTPPPTPKFTVSISASEGGSVSTEGGSYDQGTKVTVTATPDGEFLFDRWSDGNTDNPREITVTSNLSLTANFVKKKYALTVNIEGEGTVQEEVIVQGSTSTTEYNSGTSVRLTATPSDEWVFSGWSGSVESTDNPIEVSVDEAKEITATFKLKQYDLTINIEGEGTVSETIITQPTLYDSGTVVKLEATPSDNWVFSGWSGSVESTDNPIEVSVDQSKEITAIFSLINYTVEFIPIENNTSGAVFVSHSVHYEHNGKEYILGGGVNWNDPNHYRPPLVQLVRNENSWDVINVFNDVEMSEIRNSQFSENGEYIIISDPGPEWPDIEWPFSHVYIGKILDDNIQWTKVSDKPSFYHDASFGDLNNDGIIDVVGGHLGTRDGNNDNPHVYIGDGQGNFDEQKNILPEAPEGGCCGDVEIFDLNQNGINELIRIGGYWETEIMDMLEFNQSTNEFEIIHTINRTIPSNYVTENYVQINSSSTNNNSRGYMPDNHRFKDFNGDGYLDFVNEKDGLTIWYGDGNMNFSPMRLNKQAEDETGLGIWEEYYPMSGQNYFDIENDGDLDIVTRHFTLGNPNYNDGIKLYNMIYINDNGDFKRLTDDRYFVKNEDVKFNYPGSMFIPFLRNGKLCFIGHTYDNIGEGPFEVMLEIQTNIPASYWYGN